MLGSDKTFVKIVTCENPQRTEIPIDPSSSGGEDFETKI